MGFEAVIPGIKRLQTYTLHRTATGIGTDRFTPDNVTVYLAQDRDS
jgi:hypothetical protein